MQGNAEGAEAGFIERSSEPYAYDDNENQTRNLENGITSIEYNHLNLPNVILKANNKKVQFSYTADGQKLKSVYSTVVEGVWQENYPIRQQNIKDLNNRKLRNNKGATVAGAAVPKSIEHRAKSKN